MIYKEELRDRLEDPLATNLKSMRRRRLENRCRFLIPNRIVRWVNINFESMKNTKVQSSGNRQIQPQLHTMSLLRNTFS